MAKCSHETVITVAESQIGYLEKRSNAELDSFTANAGRENFTKYNRDYLQWNAGGSINMQWCAAFVSWCFVEAYGLGAAKELLCGGVHCYTPTGANRFKKKNQYIRRGQGTPKPGDVVYFYSKSKGRIGHVGIVWRVTSQRVYTIEGNTGGANTLITNGGGVRKKSYSLTSSYIDGYGRPDYASVDTMQELPSLELGDRLLVNGCEGEDVRQLQKALIELDYDCGRWGADGEFGDATELAVRAFQAAEELKIDGDYGPATHAALMAALDKEQLDEAKQVVIRGGQCWIRMAPNTGGEKLGVAKEGQIFEFQGQISEDGWLLIAYKMQNAWLSGKYGKLVAA